MHLDPTTPEGQAYIVDHLGAIYDEDRLADFLGDLHHCGECGDVFTDAKDTDYGENNERVCKSCACGINQSIRFRRAGW
jgi:hypothetical protein